MGGCRPESHRAALTGYCYRMPGGTFEAEARRARRASATDPTSPAALGTPLGEPLPDARVLPPGTSHLMPFERPELIACLVADFPTTTPAPLMPIRRAGVAT
ncbi:hypothetical protein AB0425_05640 [Actinosynnema sp. NPDC051121]